MFYIAPGDASATDAAADDSATTVAAEDPTTTTTTTTAAPGNALCSFYLCFDKPFLVCLFACFLSDPGVPGVRSVGPDVSEYIQHYVQN